jgi:hypothetical protein
MHGAVRCARDLAAAVGQALPRILFILVPQTGQVPLATRRSY